jgi:hypothetical protein
MNERPKYLGLVGLVSGSRSVVGPFVGALFAKYTSWRRIAWIDVPFIVVTLVLASIFLALATDDTDLLAKLNRVDWVGIILLFVAFAMISPKLRNLFLLVLPECHYCRYRVRKS